MLSVKCEICNSDLVSGVRMVMASILPIGTQQFFWGLGKPFRLSLARRTAYRRVSAMLVSWSFL